MHMYPWGKSLAKVGMEQQTRSQWVTGNDPHSRVLKLIGSGRSGEIFMIRRQSFCSLTLDANREPCISKSEPWSLLDLRQKVYFFLSTIYSTMQQIQQERKAVAIIQHRRHENVIMIHGAGQLSCFPADGPQFYYFDMDLCDMNLEQFIIGSDHFQSLRDTAGLAFQLLLGSTNPAPLGLHPTFPYGVRVLQQITKGLKHLHDLGLAHRDMKPQNSNSPNISLILVLFSLRDGLWKVADFGLTMQGTSRNAHITHTGRGTACYRAPELLREGRQSTFNNKVDIWSLGCILYELITNQLAFSNDYAVQCYANDHNQRRGPLPLMPVDNRSYHILLRLIECLLLRDYWCRPRTDDILALLDCLGSSKTGTDIWLSGCSQDLSRHGQVPIPS